MSGEGTSLHAKKNVGGRPTERGETKRATINMRTTPTIRAALEEAADRGGRSLAQEIEQRLERSVRQDEEVGGLVAADALNTMADVMRFTTSRLGPWTEDPDTWAVVAEGIVELLTAIKPAAAAPWRPAMLEDTPETRAKVAAYEAQMAEWEPINRSAAGGVLKFLLKRHTHGELTEEEREQAREARRRHDEVPPEPVPELPPADLKKWADGQQWRQVLVNAQRYASAIIGARTGRKASEHGA
jgi:hypothetical protein